MEQKLQSKPPVVVVLGHVDHGKSSLLEAIREDFKITEKESGGITQHVGAYEIEHNGKKITFIDTPGHEAFSAIRSRGAKVADIAVLVVDATEGVKEQTKEAIDFAKQAKVPMVVALNKIDRMEAQPDKVKEELSKQEVLVESMGGKVPSVNISAKTGDGIDDLLETINVMAEVEELKARFEGLAEGTVIEAFMDSQKGPIASLLIQEGTLKENDIIATASTLGKAKSLRNFQGKPLKQALPSQPCEVLGFEKVPKVGEVFQAFQDMEMAQKALGEEAVMPIAKPDVGAAAVSEDTDKKTLNIVLKADVLGSLEAIENIIKGLPQDKVIVKILKSAVGDIESSDIHLAEGSQAQVFGFRVKVDGPAKSLGNQRKISPKIFEVIYELVEEIRKQMEKRLAPEVKRIDLGKLKITHLFKKDKKGQIIGGKVVEGTIENNRQVEVWRQEEMAGQGRIKSLQIEKKEVGSAGKGKEAGVLFTGEAVIEEGDILQFFKQEREKGEL